MMIHASPIRPHVLRSNAEIMSSLVAAAWRRRFVIILPVLIMPTLGGLIGVFAPKTYEARMTILVQEPDKLNPILNDLAIGAHLKDRMPSLVALLKSRHVLVDVLTDLGQLDSKELATDEDLRVAAMAKALTANLIGGEMIELKLRGPRAQGLGLALGAVGTRFIEHVVAPGRGAVESSEVFLRKQLQDKDAALISAEDAYARFKQSHADKLPALYTSNVTRLAAMQQSLEEKRIELATADARFNDLRNRVATLNPVIGRLEEAIVQASGELATLRARYTDEHSEVQAASRKLRRLEEQRSALLASAKQQQNGADIQRLWDLAAGAATSGDKNAAPLLVGQLGQVMEADNRRAALRAEVEQLDQGVEKLRAAIAEFAPIEQQQQDLERSIASAREIRDMLAKRYDMARLTGSLGRYEEPDRVKIIDPPQDPTAPITPPTIIYILGGLVAGLVLGVGLATLFEILDPRLRRREDIEEAADLPIIAFVPRLEAHREPPPQP